MPSTCASRLAQMAKVLKDFFLLKAQQTPMTLLDLYYVTKLSISGSCMYDIMKTRLASIQYTTLSPTK